jgi:pimeloyl-ACP methyl ester carboxylesterase
MTDQCDFLQRTGAPALAFSRFQPEKPVGPTVVFLGGFRSDMQGSKALFLDETCRLRGQPFVRFDYRGHGRSGGMFEEGTIGLWFQDALTVIDELTSGPLVLVGSSMGGWISLLAARARPERIRGLVGIAAAPDFTKDMEAQMTAEQRSALRWDGILHIPNHYSDEPYVITRALIEDGPTHFLLEKPLALRLPVRLVQGMKDNDVPWQTAFRIKKALHDGGSEDVEVLLVEEGNHRLSRPEDLILIDAQVQALSR